MNKIDFLDNLPQIPLIANVNFEIEKTYILASQNTQDLVYYI